MKFLVGFIFLISLCFAQTITVPVKYVVDGDTIKVIYKGKAVSVRMEYIDAAETNYQGQSQGYYADLAKEWLTQKIPANSNVDIEIGEQMYDSYGRILGVVWYKGVDINKELISQGLAVTYVIYPYVTEKAISYGAEEEKAIANGLGLFSFTNPLYELPFEFRLRISKRDPDKWVGNLTTKKYYDPIDYDKVPISLRIFFFKEEDASKAGFYF